MAKSAPQPSVTIFEQFIARGRSRGRMQRVHTLPEIIAFFFILILKICFPHQSVMSFLGGEPSPEKILDPLPLQCRSPFYCSDVKCTSQPIVSEVGSNPDGEFEHIC